MKLKRCTSESGRHSWKHERNFIDKRVHVGPHGTAVAMAQRGEYRCNTCGMKKVGIPSFAAGGMQP